MKTMKLMNPVYLRNLVYLVNPVKLMHLRPGHDRA